MNEKLVKQTKMINKDEEKIMKTLHRKNSKHLVEKKRRERINKSLNELKKIIFADSPESLHNNKLEKAHILEMAVKHIRKSNNADNHKTVECGHTDGEYRCGYLACANRVLSFVSAVSCQTDLKSRLIENITETIPSRYALPQNEANSGPMQQHNLLSSNLAVSNSNNLQTLNCNINDCETTKFQHKMKIQDKPDTRFDNLNSGGDNMPLRSITDKNELFQSQYFIPDIKCKTMMSPKYSDQIMLYLIPVTPNDKHLSHNTSDHSNASNHGNNHDSATRLSKAVRLGNETNTDNLDGVNTIKSESVQDICNQSFNLSNCQVWRPW